MRSTLLLLSLLISLFVSKPLDCLAQKNDSLLLPPVSQKKLNTLIWTSSASYAVSMAGLYHLWYKDSKQQSFRFFNDNREWKQMDKVGHFFSSFYLSYGSSRAMQWAHVPERKADLIGASIGFLLLVPVEIFDGFSDAYGASTGDLIADATGPLLYLGQKRLWNEIRIYPKYSFHTTKYASIRPNVLGDNYISQSIKDYNGQTYWFSFDVDKFTRFPSWLNIAVGYGAEAMVYAHDRQNRQQGYDAYRQYYVSIDFDLTSIKTNSKAVKTLLFFANMIKLPAPAISFSKKGTTLHPFYF